MPNSGSCKFSVSYDYKKYSPTFTINLFILLQHFTFFNNSDIFQISGRCVLLFGRVVITP